MRIGLTGAPSSGKSSVLGELQKRGFHIFSEAATQIIETEKAKGREVVDIVRDSDFQQRIHTLKREQYDQYVPGILGVYDTTFVDDIAHRLASGVEIESIRQVVRGLRYDVIFYLEHPGVVEDNGIRVENTEQVQYLDNLKRKALETFGYPLSIVQASDIVPLDGTHSLLVPTFSEFQDISARIIARAEFIGKLVSGL